MKKIVLIILLILIFCFIGAIIQIKQLRQSHYLFHDKSAYSLAELDKIIAHGKRLEVPEVGHEKENFIIYTNSLGVRNSYAYLWFKIPKEFILRILSPANNGELYDFDYSKDLYICDCKNGKVGLLYSGIYKNDKLLQELKFYNNPDFVLSPKELKPVSEIYYEIICSGYKNSKN